MTRLEEMAYHELLRLGREVDRTLYQLLRDARQAIGYSATTHFDAKLAEARAVNRRGQLLYAHIRLLTCPDAMPNLPGNVRTNG